MELPNVRSVAPDSAEEKGNAAERVGMMQTCRLDVTKPRWRFRAEGTGCGGTQSGGAIKEPKHEDVAELLRPDLWLTPNG